MQAVAGHEVAEGVGEQAGQVLLGSIFRKGGRAMTFTVHGIDGFLHRSRRLAALVAAAPGLPGPVRKAAIPGALGVMVRRGSATGARPAARRRLRQRRGAGNVVLTFLLKRRAVPYVREGAVLAPDVPVLPPRCSRPRRANRRGGQAAVSVSWPGSLRMRRSGSQRSLASSPRGLAAFRSESPGTASPTPLPVCRTTCSVRQLQDTLQSGRLPGLPTGRCLVRSPIRCRASSALAPPRRAHGAHA